MSKRKKEKKQREDIVYGVVNVGEDRTLTVHYNAETDEVELVGAEPGSTGTERSYVRESGKRKIVSTVPSNGSTPFTAARALFSYDAVMAIDTNTRVVDGRRCAVCMSYYVPGKPSSLGKEIPFLPLISYLIVDISASINPETIGWHLILSRHLKPSPKRSGDLAVVVDSELGNHREINDRKIGYYKDYLLPDGVKLVYASADVDKETLQGGMIRMCDDASRKAFDALLTQRGLPPIEAHPLQEDFGKFYLIGTRDLIR